MTAAEETIMIRTATIRLDACLKFAGAVGTGGEAKQWIQQGWVAVNGETETRRRRQLEPGDRIRVADDEGTELVRLRIATAEPGSD